jgi:uncharacterized protein
MLIRLLIFIIVAVLAYRMAKSWFGGSAVTHEKPGQKGILQADDTLVKDPQCGVYFPRRDGVVLTVKGKDLYFCSSQCAQRYLEDDG